MLQSINQLAELTGKDRRTITQRLKDLDHERGPKSAHLYESEPALAAIYYNGAANLEMARTEQAISQANLNKVREEDLRRQRIPIDIPVTVNDQVMQSVAAALKCAKGKPLTEALINSILAKFRDIPAQLKW